MDAALYLSYQKTPLSVTGQSLKELEEVLSVAPWFTDAQILFALNLFRENHPSYSSQLKKAAIYAPDRRILKGLMDLARQAEVHVQAEPLHEEISPTKEEPAPVPDIPIPPAPAPAEEPGLREQLLTIVHRRLAEIETERLSGPAVPDSAEPSLPKRILSKEELIEKFIREEPRISTPRTSFFNPTQTAIRSNTDDEEIVTETLARLYAEQGNQAKAVKIYEKLSLLFPEKSRYFAAQIEKINLK